MDKNSIAIIPARGGSKRIPKKNIKSFCGKPLIAYSIQTAINSKLFDKVVVSTDSEEIAEVAKKYGAEILYRPKELADDYAGSDVVFNHAINELNKDNKYNFACMIYATAPFLQIEYLKEAFEKLKNSTACYSFSATSFEYPIWRSFRIKDDRCEMFWPENYPKRSQDLEEAYHDAGQFYWRKLDCKSNKIFFSKNSIPIIIPRYLVQDIDTMEDFIRAEKMYKAVFNANI
jgi:pseudaminic acid cytidylyltransferase